MISRDACTATMRKVHSTNDQSSPWRTTVLFATHARNPSVAASNTILVARLTMKAGTGPGGFDGDIEMHPALVDTLGMDSVLDVLTTLLEGLFGVVYHPVRAPVIFENLVIDESHNLDGGLDVVGPAVRVAVEHFNFLVQRRPLRYDADVSQRLQDHFRRRIDDYFPRCLYSHSSQASNADRLTGRVRANSLLPAYFADGCGQRRRRPDRSGWRAGKTRGRCGLFDAVGGDHR